SVAANVLFRPGYESGHRKRRYQKRITGVKRTAAVSVFGRGARRMSTVAPASSPATTKLVVETAAKPWPSVRVSSLGFLEYSLSLLSARTPKIDPTPMATTASPPVAYA